jgi:hypothetical protein
MLLKGNNIKCLRVENKLTWNKANGRLRSSDFVSARSVDLRERYAQTVFTFWTTLVISKQGIIFRIYLNTEPSFAIKFHNLTYL